jgi:LysM repeat protein
MARSQQLNYHVNDNKFVGEILKMRQIAILITILMVVIGASLVLAQDENSVEHVVQANENLFRIAQQYGVTVQAIVEANNLTDPNNLTVGQVLIIPLGEDVGAGGELLPLQTEEAAPVPTQTTVPLAGGNTATPLPQPIGTEEALATTTARTHLVKDGESLYTIAGLYGVTVVSLAELNGITDYNLIRIGQVLQIPPVTSPLAPPRPVTATPAPPPITPVPSTALTIGFGRGVEIFGTDNLDVAQGVGEWIQVRIAWKDFEPEPDEIDFDGLDALVKPLDEAGLNILLTIADAPDWARTNPEGSGPADDNADYAAFVGAVAGHYAGVVDAYQIWSEPNLSRAWAGKPLSAQGYVDMLKLAYNAVKLADPAAVVVSAGLGQTTTNDGVTAIADRVFLDTMYAAGAADFTDAIGVQAFGWANPPDSSCCMNNRPSVGGWDDQRAFFFLDTLRDYRQIMNAHNDDGTFLWVTGFGWGSSEGIDGEVKPEFGYVTYTSLQEQAQYTERAFQLGRELTYVGPMFLSNVNGCAVLGDSLCYWDMLTVDGTPRLAGN